MCHRLPLYWRPPAAATLCARCLCMQGVPQVTLVDLGLAAVNASLEERSAELLTLEAILKDLVSGLNSGLDQRKLGTAVLPPQSCVLVVKLLEAESGPVVETGPCVLY